MGSGVVRCGRGTGKPWLGEGCRRETHSRCLRSRKVRSGKRLHTHNVVEARARLSLASPHPDTGRSRSAHAVQGRVVRGRLPARLTSPHISPYLPTSPHICRRTTAARVCVPMSAAAGTACGVMTGTGQVRRGDDVQHEGLGEERARHEAYSAHPVDAVSRRSLERWCGTGRESADELEADGKEVVRHLQARTAGWCRSSPTHGG